MNIGMRKEYAPFQPGTIKDEAMYEELERLSCALGIPVPMMHVKISTTEPDGKETVHYDGRSRTYTRQFWNYIWSMNTMGLPPSTTSGEDGGTAIKSAIYGASSYSLTPGTVHSGGLPTFQFGSYNATAGVDSVGVIIGRGSQAENFEHVNLTSRIRSGSGSGQISYAATATPASTWDSASNTWSSVLTRFFNNNSVGVITVTECGILAAHGTGGTSYLIVRDLLGASISVAVAAQLTVSYTFSLTYPTKYPTYNFNTVQMLLFNNNAANGTSVFTDQSSYGRTVTVAAAGVTYSNASVPTGMTTVASFNGSGYLTIADASALELLDKDFVLEFWIFPSGVGTEILMSKSASNATTGSFRVTIGNTYIRVSLSADGATEDIAAPTFSIPYPPQWTAIRMVRAQNTIAMYVDGARAAMQGLPEQLSALGISVYDNASVWSFGANADGSGNKFTGKVSSLRFTIGHHRNVDVMSAVAYTPPTLPLPLT